MDLVRQQNKQAELLQSEVAGYAAQSKQGVMILPNGQNPTMREMSPTRTMVFLSRSMPKPSLIALLKQGAGRKDVVFAFRGWGDGPVTDMFAYSRNLVSKLPASMRNNPPQIIVMPSAFREYSISHAPAVLHRDTDEKWYLVQGVRSINDAIGKIRSRSFNRRLSQQYRVTEPDQAEVMRLKMKQKDLKPTLNAAKQGVLNMLKGNLDIPSNREKRRFNYTPYVAASTDIYDPKTGTVLYPKGTRFNVLALDPSGNRTLVVIDGRSSWQVEFAKHLLKMKSDTLVLYTRLGRLDGAGIPANPLDKTMQSRLKVTGVPTYYRQNGYSFDVVAVRPGDAK